MRKKFWLLCLIWMLCLAVPVRALDTPQERDDCSIEVLVRYAGENVQGGSLTAVRVGYVAQENGDWFFFQELTGVKLKDITSPDAPAAQWEFYESNRNVLYSQTKAVEGAPVLFEGLQTGLYLIFQEEAAPGFSPMSPFLVSVPYLEDGEYQYHVTAVQKSELEREPEPSAPPPTEPDPSLPQTGQTNWPIPVMAASGLTLIVIGCLLRFGKKPEEMKNI
jgi:hypothetical protein